MKFSCLFAYLTLPVVVLLLTDTVAAKRIGGETNDKILQGNEKIFAVQSDERQLQSVRLSTTDFLFYLYALCYSSHTTAEVEGRGKVSMSKIEVGDQVLTSSGKFETVYAMAHRSLTQSAKFIQIFTGDDEPLELSEKHMVFTEENSNPVPADSIKVGDYLRTLDGALEVTTISTVNRKGVFNPLTTDGTIVASGIVSSTYSAFLSKDEWIRIHGYGIVTHHNFFEKAVRPYKFFCTRVSSNLCKTENEKIMIAQAATLVADYWLQLGEMTRIASLLTVITMVYSIDILFSLSTIVLFAGAMLMLVKMKRKSMKTL